MGAGNKSNDEDWFKQDPLANTVVTNENDFRMTTELDKRGEERKVYQDIPEEEKKETKSSIAPNAVNTSVSLEMRQSNERQASVLLRKETMGLGNSRRNMDSEVVKRKKTLAQFTGLADNTSIP